MIYFIGSLLGFIDLKSSSIPNTTNTLIELTRNFVNEAIYFNHYQHIEKDDLLCYQEDEYNSTYLMIMNKIKSCSNINYIPRQLNSQQISWKKLHHDTNDTDKAVNGTSTNQIDSKKPKDVIHDYLVLVLLLPNHPFSTDLLDTIRSVAPLYPHVVFAMTNGLEMKEFCAQYNIHSFPKVLMFKKGLLLGKYSGQHRVLDFASQMTAWTDSFPCAIPFERKKTHALHVSNIRWTPSLPTFSWNALGPSTEPLKAHSGNTNILENNLFVISAIYFVVRVIYFVCYRSNNAAV
jgi:hypothetical protein